MIADTRIFGKVTIDEEKVIHFANGIIGFPDLKDFILIHDGEKEGGISWLQSVQEFQFALPVMDPLLVMPDYNPQVEDELIHPLGELIPEEMLVLVTVTAPSDIRNLSINLKAPIIINAAERKAIQVVAEGEEHPVKYMIYDILEAAKKAGE